jgi:hypothetical protein
MAASTYHHFISQSSYQLLSALDREGKYITKKLYIFFGILATGSTLKKWEQIQHRLPSAKI